MTIKELLAKLEKHEEVCAVRLEAIDKRLDEGSKRFVRLEYYICGIYAAIFVSAFADRLI